jgi:hypothetical protein
MLWSYVDEIGLEVAGKKDAFTTRLSFIFGPLGERSRYLRCIFGECDQSLDHARVWWEGRVVSRVIYESRRGSRLGSLFYLRVKNDLGKNWGFLFCSLIYLLNNANIGFLVLKLLSWGFQEGLFVRTSTASSSKWLSSSGLSI